MVNTQNRAVRCSRPIWTSSRHSDIDDQSLTLNSWLKIFVRRTIHKKVKQEQEAAMRHNASVNMLTIVTNTSHAEIYASISSDVLQRKAAGSLKLQILLQMSSQRFPVLSNSVIKRKIPVSVRFIIANMLLLLMMMMAMMLLKLRDN